MQNDIQKTLDAAQADLDRIRRSLAEAVTGGKNPHGAPIAGYEPQLEDIKIGMRPEVRDAVLRKLRQVLDR